MSPRVSVIMPCYNAVDHLNQSVGSVLAQTFSEWELVIVDDGSKDTSWMELQRLATMDIRLRIFEQANLGAAAARNHALSMARSEYIAFLDADDTWHREFLTTMLSALDNNPDVVIAYCGWQNLGHNSKGNKPFVPLDYENDEKIISLLSGCRWPIHAAMTRSKALIDNDTFDPTLTSCMDYDLWLRLGAVSKLLCVPRVLAYYHHHEGEQITHNRARIALNHWRVQRKFLKMNPAISNRLGVDRRRELTHGELLRRGYDTYWKGDLPAARRIFRTVMKYGYGKPKDWRYMLPSFLPESCHRLLIRLGKSTTAYREDQ